MKLRYPNEVECARQARRSLSVIRQRLSNPTQNALESCTPYLRNAIDSLASLQRRLEQPDSRSAINRPELRNEVSALRRELAQVNALMQNTCAFHAALSSLLAPQPDHSVRYMASGIVVAPRQSTLLAEG